jgi:hypothetical protein
MNGPTALITMVTMHTMVSFLKVFFVFIRLRYASAGIVFFVL